MGDEEGVCIGLTWSTGTKPGNTGLTGGKAGSCTGGRDTGGPGRNGGDLGGRVGGHDRLEGLGVTTIGAVGAVVLSATLADSLLDIES